MMKDASEVLTEARFRASNGDVEGAIRLLRSELDTLSGDLEARRLVVALLLTYYGRREKLSEGMRTAEEHFERDPASIIDSPPKVRIVMNYAALKAASGNIPEAIDILGDILLATTSSDVSDDDLERVRTMLESLSIAGKGSPPDSSALATVPGSRSRAYLASAHISRLIELGSFSEAVRLSRAILRENPNLKDGPLEIALTLNLGVGLVGEGAAKEGGEWLARSYEAATWCLMRSGTLFSLVARSYAVWLIEAGQSDRGAKVLLDLLEAQLERFGDMSKEVVDTKTLLSKIGPGGLLARRLRA